MAPTESAMPEASVMPEESTTAEAAPVAQAPAVTEAGAMPTIQVNQAMVLQADVEASNGMIYVIDQVMLPPALTAGL
jgi:uncharacterized surface protein with fasciclin (FAS1) repeats